MSEGRRKFTARTMVFGLLAANVLFFAYARISLDARATAASHIEDLQINPARIKLLNAATRGPGGQAAQAACLEWGPLGPLDAAKAETALGRLPLSRAPIQRTIGETTGGKRVAFYVREPDGATVARIAEIQRGFPGTQIKAGPCPG